MFTCQGCGYKAKTLKELFKHINEKHGSFRIKIKTNLEKTEKEIKGEHTQKSKKAKTPIGYSSPLDRAVDKATEKGRRILFSPVDDGYKEYLKEFRRKNLRYFD